MPTDSEKPAGTGATISAATSENIFVKEVNPSTIMKREGIRDHDAIQYAQQQQQKPQDEQGRQQEQQQQTQLKSNRHPIVDFAIAGVSTSCACVLSNPVSLNAQQHAIHALLLLYHSIQLTGRMLQGCTYIICVPALAGTQSRAHMLRERKFDGS